MADSRRWPASTNWKSCRNTRRKGLSGTTSLAENSKLDTQFLNEARSLPGRFNRPGSFAFMNYWRRGRDRFWKSWRTVWLIRPDSRRTRKSRRETARWWRKGTRCDGNSIWRLAGSGRRYRNAGRRNRHPGYSLSRFRKSGRQDCRQHADHQRLPSEELH